MGHYRKKQLTVLLTNKCNMDCKYCSASAQFTNRNEKQTIDISFAKKAIEYYFLEEGYSQLRFFGAGEPSLEVSIMQELIAYAGQIAGRNLITEMQTNGQFEARTARWLGDHLTKIWVSLDGWEEINQKYRPSNSEFSIIESNVRHLCSNTFVGIRTTIHKDTNHIQKKLIDYFMSLGVGIIYAEPEYENTRGNSTSEKLNMVEFARKFYKAYEYAKSLNVFYGTSLITNFDEEVEISCRCSLPAPHLTTDGFITCCDLAYFGTTELKKFVIGKWNPVQNMIQFNEENVNAVKQRNIHNLEICKDCPILKHCAGGCTGIAYLRTGSLFKIDEESCNATKYLAERIKPGAIPIPELHP